MFCYRLVIVIHKSRNDIWKGVRGVSRAVCRDNIIFSTPKILALLVPTNSGNPKYNIYMVCVCVCVCAVRTDILLLRTLYARETYEN